jgi:hypothetical protein
MRNSNTLKVLLFTRDISNNPQKLTIYARITLMSPKIRCSFFIYSDHVLKYLDNK